MPSSPLHDEPTAAESRVPEELSEPLQYQVGTEDERNWHWAKMLGEGAFGRVALFVEVDDTKTIRNLSRQSTLDNFR
jgi:hypothetical protein